MVADIKKKASAREDAKSTAQRTVGQSVRQNRDCSQIENEEEEEEDWQTENQMEVQWVEDERLEEILERRKEGSSLQAEVMQKVPELVVHERISQGKKKVRGAKEKNKVKGWSTDEMKDKPNNLLEEITKEVRK